MISLDSLRYDVAVEAPTPHLDEIFRSYDAGPWRRVFAQSTYTLPSHLSLLQGAIGPSNLDWEPVYDRRVCSFFKVALPWRAEQRALYEVPAAQNVVKGFERQGYRTIGIGGVGWFNPAYETSGFWKERFFQRFHWQPEFGEENPDSFVAQLGVAERELCDRDGSPLFFFLNVSATHDPYRGEPASKEGQGRALQYVDRHFPRLIELLPKPCHVLLWSDHGDCFGEDGVWGHGFPHEKVLEVPMVHFVAT